MDKSEFSERVEITAKYISQLVISDKNQKVLQSSGES